MKIYNYFLFLIGLIFAFSCSYIKNVQLLTEGKINRKNYVQTIPFEWRNGYSGHIDPPTGDTDPPSKFIF